MMKPIAFTAILLQIAFMAASCQPNTSQTSSSPPVSPTVTSGKSQFFCQEDKRGIPTTYGTNAIGKPVPIIGWDSDYFTDAGWSPRARCEHVSDKFAEADRRGILNYITTGKENDLPVICVSSFNGGRCQLTLFTLKDGADASQVIHDLFDASAKGPITQRPNDAPYVDFQEFLNSREPD